MARSDTNLPAARGRLIGREQEAALVRELILHADGRLVTLTGAGGIGKTSLAFDVARRLLDDMPDGIWLVDLETVEDESAVATSACRSLGLADQQGRSQSDVLSDFLEPRQSLLVIDDCDRVIAATAALVDRLLDRCPDLRILVTCRMRLGLHGESAMVVAPLGIAGPEMGPDAARAPAIQLFVERARGARPGFVLRREDVADVAAICRQLDGMPLAIELAAAQAAALSPAEIAAHLPVQEGLASAIESSLRLLPEDAVRLFRRLSVFAGGWTLEAAETVCRPDPEAPDGRPVSAALFDLVDRSLVVREDTASGSRFRMLAPIAEEAARRLSGSDEHARVALAHAGCYLALITGTTPGWRTNDIQQVRLIGSEYANCVAALAFAERAGAVALVVGFNLAMLAFWGTRGWLHAAVRQLDAGLAVVGDRPGPGRAYILGGAAQYRRLIGDHATAAAQAVEAERLFEALGDRVGTRAVICIQADVAADRGDLDLARQLYDRIPPLLEGEPSPLPAGVWHANVGDLEWRRGDAAAARRHLEEARGRLAAAKSWYLGKVLTTLGELALEDGRTEEAERRFAEAFAHARGFDAHLYAVLALHGLGRVALERRDFRRAATLCAAALAMRDATGWQLRADERRRADRDIERLRAALPEGPFDHAWRLGLDLDLDAASVLLASPTDPAVRTDDGLVDALTPREREIATLVAEGLTNPQIAERLAIAPGTVRIHVERILGKLGLTSRVQVATWVVRSEAVAQQAEPA